MSDASIALIAVDMDGTLLDSDSQLAPDGAKALLEASQLGVRVVISTTRTYRNVQGFARQIGLRDPLICCNGAELWGSPQGPLWERRAVPRHVGLAVAELADAQGWALITTVEDTTYYRQRPGQALGAIEPSREIVATNREGLVGPASRILSYEPDAIRGIRALCEQRYADEVYIETYYNLDETVRSIGVYALGADKGTALRLVMARLGIALEHVMVIGDNPNDLPMFPCARLRVVMGNGTVSAKVQADVVAPTNDEEGVAWAVRRFVLKG